MLHFVRRSLLVQLLGAYLLFVAVILATTLKINDVAQEQVRSQVQTTDLALGREIALETDNRLRTAESSLVRLAGLAPVRRAQIAGMQRAFEAFKLARSDVDLVYWLGSRGTLQVSVPTNQITLGADFSSDEVFRRARLATGPVIEDGIVDLTTYHFVVIFAMAVRDPGGRLLGILGTNLRLDDLSQPLVSIIASEAKQHQHVVLSIVDAQGRLIASPQRERLLQPVLAELPGAADALHRRVATRQGTDSSGRQWLYSSVPIPSLGWAVVVQRSTADALAVITTFRRWIIVGAGFFALGGLLFCVILLRRVVRPLRALARRHGALPAEGVAAPPALGARSDEIGDLARSLSRLEHDVVDQLAELGTLLETSNAVVNSLDPTAVGRTIIREVQRLVDIQAAAVYVPDDDGVLRVLVSVGRAEEYDRAVRIRPDHTTSPIAQALHDARPVQMIAGEDGNFPATSLAAGFRAVLAIPIISPHVGNVVLVVQRTHAQRFTDREIDLLLTFANYATLAWEHAVLYERSDERLRQVARTQEAIMRSMSDGLVLTSVEGIVLYANPGAAAIVGLSPSALEGSHVHCIYDSLQRTARDPAAFDRRLSQLLEGERTGWLMEGEAGGQYRAINLRGFDVHDEAQTVIGRGLLLRDATRESEIDRFKTTLLGAVGHELRTPLAAIKGYASTLLQDDVTWSPGEQREFLGTISAEADRLAQLVSNLLDLSRLEAGLLLLRRSPAHLDELVSHATARLGTYPGHGGTGQRLRIEIPCDLPAVDVDPARVEVVITNLLANAATYGNGRVDITAERGGDVVVVHVADDGPGIAPDEVPHIFERFYRARLGSRRRSGGTGLGLAICKAFVEALDGEIWVDTSESGTVMSFSLPVAPATSALAGTRARASGGAAG
jgi:PAS domain S-box-containing protein